MTPQELLEKLLAGEKVRKVIYGDLHGVLCLAKYKHMFTEGSYRYWKHDGHRDVLLLKDNLDKAMYPQYIDKAQKHLLVVKNAGGF